MLKTLVTALTLAVAATGASAATMHLDSKLPQSFNTGASYGNVWNKTFDFTVAQGTTAYLTVFDFFKSGDQFVVSVNGEDVGTTSTPGIGGKITDDSSLMKAERRDNYLTVFDNDLFSSGEIVLTGGDYSVTGSLFASPRAESTGRIWLTSESLGAAPLTAFSQPTAPAVPGTTSLSAVPLPAAGWMLIAALGGLGLMRRKS